MSLLKNPEVLDLVSQAVNSKLAWSRDRLMGSLDPQIAALAPAQAPDLQQLLLGDIQLLNGLPVQEGQQHPMLTWLQTAQLLAGLNGKYFGDKFEEVAARVDQRHASVPAGAYPESAEAVFHVDDRLSVEFFAEAVEVAARVVKIEVPLFNAQGPVMKNRQHMSLEGTGWVFGQGGLVATNAHVIRARLSKTAVVEPAWQARQTQAATVVFDFEQKKAPIEAKIERIVAIDVNLDYAIVQLAAGSEDRRPLPLQGRRIDLSLGHGGPDNKSYQPVNIIQHPDGGLKQAAFRNNLVTRSEDEVLRYFTDTEHGSSGAPVCNDDWEVVALHRSSAKLDKVSNFQGRDEASANVGTQMAAILGHLRNHAEWPQIEPRLDLA